ncbi:MAG TPA: hypothetical protein VK528_13835 [Flavobacterium sp.]|nr:hypothetical protein [Flavobacterium sp.]
MKTKQLFAVVLLAGISSLNAQTLFAPSGLLGTSSVPFSVGIGTSTPARNLHVEGNVLVNSSLNGNPVIEGNGSVLKFGTNQNRELLKFTTTATVPNASIFTIYNRRLTNASDWTSLVTRLQASTDVSPQGYIEYNGVTSVTTDNSYKGAVSFGFEKKEYMRIFYNGKVRIGGNTQIFPTTVGSADVSTYKLFVNGGILTEQIRVSLDSPWADYVFHKNYKLASLSEVESFIADNGHLPNVPSAQQVKENGIELGDMAKIQQEKIEELTLYLIQQNKAIEELKAEVKALKERK